MIVMFSSCKKEIIQPNNRSEVVDYEFTAPNKIQKAGTENSQTSGKPNTGNPDGEITDPNDDDYSIRRPIKTKG